MAVKHNGSGGHGQGRNQPPTPAAPDHYVLRLYVTGLGLRSVEAVSRIKRLCEQRLSGRYELTIVDLYQQPELARRENIVAAPTLIKLAPPPERRLIGNLADQERVLQGLALPSE